MVGAKVAADAATAEPASPQEQSQERAGQGLIACAIPFFYLSKLVFLRVTSKQEWTSVCTEHRKGRGEAWCCQFSLTANAAFMSD
ncbi:hypothetical protein EBH_0053760 [Eimeria brunetti]|uniref:Uncharacterized protein n=1 Tax=Eimeria brunetti TaxID=51314 RepID=U6LWK6_9EIME|nr:hypothetical protein EBH_0053760 [Eimeria brunetti]